MSNQGPREPHLLTIYRRYLEDRDTVQFVGIVRHRYAPGTLERLARDRRPELRRAAVFSLGFVGEFTANQTVGRALLDEDPMVRQLAKNACRFVWNRSGSKQHRRQLVEIIRLNAVKEHRDAAEKASKLIDVVPSLAEAWYQRGAACYQLEQFAQVTSHCHQALELNPYHFVAATAIGEAYLRLDDPCSALESFRRALRLNPELNGLRDQVALLARQFGDE